MHTRRSLTKGFTLIEVVVGAAIILLFISALSAALSLYVSILPDRVDNVKAQYLVQEGIEVVKYLRNEGWDTNIAALSNNTDYYLQLDAGAWSLTTTEQITDGFTRTIVFSDMYRDGNNDIATSGTLDLDGRLVTVTASWASGTRSESLQTYITDILGN